MIDWVSFSLSWDGPPVGVQFLKREAWDLPIEPAFNRPVQVEGSWSSSLAVQAIGGRLYVSGNPVKWLTGQNVCGSNDLRRLVAITYEKVVQLLGLPDSLAARRDLATGDVPLTRVDCTFSYRVGSDDDVVSWLSAMEKACHVRYRGRGHFDEGMCSLMFGLGIAEGGKPKASRRSTFKFYNKLREMQKREPKCSGEVLKRIRQIVDGAVRGEACYRGVELKRLGYDRLKAWNEGTSLALHREWVDRMEMTESYTLKSDDEKKLPRKLHATYRLWRSGETMQAILSRPTFYRHRRDLLAHGIDISAPCAGGDPVKVIPILRVIEAKPMGEDETEAMFWEMVKAA